MLGYSGGDSLKITFNAPADGEDIDEQVNILDEEMARYPDVIAIASIEKKPPLFSLILRQRTGSPSLLLTLEIIIRESCVPAEQIIRRRQQRERRNSARLSEMMERSH